jgi:hypothetical protein
MSRVNIKAGLSERQIERQKVREGGKYSRYPRCELCGKTVISGQYWSDERCNATGVGLVLHQRCGHKADKMNNKEFIKTFGKNLNSEQRNRYLKEINEEFPDRK